MLYHAAYSVPCRSEVLTRIEISRMLNEVLTNRSRHGQSEVSIDIYLADTVLCSFCYHFLRNALRAGDLSAVLVAELNELRQYSRSAVKNERSVRDESVYLL